jgi:hypothetical protein
VNTKLEEFNNKITILNNKVDSILSTANDLHTTSPTINDAAPDTPAKTKQFPFDLMPQTWLFYCKDNNMTIIPKAETKLSGWVRDTWKAYKQYINNEPSTMTKEREELFKAANFPFNYPTSTNHPSEKKAQSTPTKHGTENTLKEKEVGKNPNPTSTPSSRSSTIKKDTTTAKDDSKTLVPKKQVGKKSITPPTKSIAGITNDKLVSGKKSHPIATKSTAVIGDGKIVSGKKSNPTATKSSGSFPFFKKLDEKKI